MRHQRLGALVLGIIQRILRVHLVLRLGAAQIGQQVLFLDAALGEFDADFADLVIALGLVQRAPTVPDLELDLILPLNNLPPGAVTRNERGAIRVALGLAVQARIHDHTPAPPVALKIRQGKIVVGIAVGTDVGGQCPRIDPWC